MSDGGTINRWVELEKNGAIATDEFFDRLRDSVLGFEIRRNQEKLNVAKHTNQLKKQEGVDSGAKLIVSTIHGAKGLEFDNVVLLYKEDPGMDQEKKRLYYVALTRAVKREFVLAHGSVKHAPIVTAHEAILAALEKKAADASSADNDLSDDD